MLCTTRPTCLSIKLPAGRQWFWDLSANNPTSHGFPVYFFPQHYQAKCSGSLVRSPNPRLGRHRRTSRRHLHPLRQCAPEQASTVHLTFLPFSNSAAGAPPVNWLRDVKTCTMLWSSTRRRPSLIARQSTAPACSGQLYPRNDRLI